MGEPTGTEALVDEGKLSGYPSSLFRFYIMGMIVQVQDSIRLERERYLETNCRPNWQLTTFVSRRLIRLDYSPFTNDMQRFSGNIFATGCCSHMGVSPLVLELKL